MFVWRLCWVVNLPIDLSISPFLSALSLPSFSSPIGGLQIRYDSSGSLPGPALGLLGAGGGGGETLPPVATSIEQLLERQWNEGQSFLLQQGAQGDGETHTHWNTHTHTHTHTHSVTHLMNAPSHTGLKVKSKSTLLSIFQCIQTEKFKYRFPQSRIQKYKYIYKYIRISYVYTINRHIYTYAHIKT